MIENYSFNYTMGNSSFNNTIYLHSMNSSNTSAPRIGSTKYLSDTLQIIITTCYIVGILGNLLALVFLCKKTTRPSNPKYKLMLKCLSVNDLTALSGMLILMYIRLYFPETQNNIWYCRARVFWRVFGLGSGCVAIVMAVERWLALTKPFVYQKHVTVVLIQRSIFGLWISAVILACLPFFGFGLYYDNEVSHGDSGKCVRYRSAKLPKDVAYAFLYFSIGMLLCVCIVFCNIAVMRSLCYKGTQSRIREPVLMRRISRSVSKMSNTSTREEIAFGRLMGFLCVIFVICWMPQMLTILLAQMDPSTSLYGHKFFKLADILMALHFLLDPYVYVLQRLPTIRNFFCSNKLQIPQYKSSIRMSSYDPSFFIARI